MVTLSNVLVSTDFSPGSRAALAQAARIATKAGASLHILHVVRHEIADDLRRLMPDAALTVDEHLRARAMDELKEDLADAGVGDSAAVHVGVGNPIHEIIAHVDRLGVDLLVIGASGHNGRRMGTTAGRCVRKVDTPVLLVPPVDDADQGAESGPIRVEPFRTIMACVDFSKHTKRVIELASKVADFDDGRVTGVHVYEVPWERARWGNVPEDSARLETELRAMQLRRFNDLLPPEAEGSAHPIGFDAVRGMDYGKALVDYANEQGVDLVVTGTTGRTALGYMLLGTTAEKVMRDTTCAVLAMK